MLVGAAVLFYSHLDQSLTTLNLVLKLLCPEII